MVMVVVVECAGGGGGCVFIQKHWVYTAQRLAVPNGDPMSLFIDKRMVYSHPANGCPLETDGKQPLFQKRCGRGGGRGGVTRHRKIPKYQNI